MTAALIIAPLVLLGLAGMILACVALERSIEGDER